ncbi:MAG: PP2C family protein-serine/threonine phosphatase [Anaerolineae bacterium]
MKVWDLEHGALSCCGEVRQDNQDAVQICRACEQPVARLGHLYALADGMGGYEDGRLAAQLAIDALNDSYYHSHHGNIKAHIRQAMQQANLAVYRASQDRGVRMGTTLTTLVINGRQLIYGHIGDSRLYLLREGRATVLTRDHTAVGDMVRLGVLKPESVRSHSQRSLLNRCLGLGLFIQADVNQIELRAGDALVLCSDGVWAYVEDNEFVEHYHAQEPLEVYNQELVALASEHESDDNMSIVTVRLTGITVTEPDMHQHRHWPFLGNRLASKVK